MSQKSEKKAQEVNKEAQEPKKNTPPAGIYTINEFAKAPQSVGANSPDIVRAALKLAGKDSYTQAEATEIVKRFSEKEVH